MTAEGPVLVTGASGFIGRALLAAAPSLVGVTRADADLRDRSAVAALFRRIRPSRVIHLAAVTGGVQFHQDRHAEVLLANTQIDANVLDAAAESGVGRLVALVSSCAYPSLDQPASEADLHTGAPYAGSLGMGLAKRHLDQVCRTISGPTSRTGAYTTITPVTVYGPGERSDADRSHVVPALIARALTARRAGGPLLVWGTGAAVRQFLYIDDLVSLLLDEIARDTAPPTMIIAPDHGCTIRTLADTIAAIVGVTAPPEYTGQQEGQRVKQLRSVLFEARHPGVTFTPFDTGLARTIRSVSDGS